VLRILIADDDPATREVLASQLARPDRIIATASDGEEALATAITFAPHLVITDVEMPHMSGWDLVVRLRQRPETALTPVIFATGFGDHRARMRGLRLGAVDYVVKPIDLEELSLRVINALAHCLRAQEAVQAALLQGIAGSLAHLPLASLLNVLAHERMSGVLDLLTGDTNGRLLVHQGNIVSVRLDGPDALAGVEGLHRLLRTTAFHEGPVTAVDEIRTSTMELLIEGARRLDEEGRIERP